ncbi:MAG: hypothetical protein KatS3mg057_3095 [Herpetosiphonaceae bacterium]|nr:MAG: hypothetical protein KatS3mg057_3095 [Herpetosiphonaceae bacterium]
MFPIRISSWQPHARSLLGPKQISVANDRYVGITPFFSFIAGLAYYTNADPEGAADEFQAALIGDIIAADAEPDEPAHTEAQALTLLFLGNARFLQGDYEAAERAYRRSIELRPEFGESLCNLGLLKAIQGDNVAALDLLAEAVSAAPDSPFVHYNLGILQQRLGRLEQALESFRRATASRSRLCRGPAAARRFAAQPGRER